MLLVPEDKRCFRILGLFPHVRHTGHVVLDHQGVIPGSAWSAETRRFRTHDARVVSITRLVESSIARHEVRLVAIGRSRDVSEHQALASDVIAAITTLGVCVEVLDERALVDAFHVPGVAGYDHLGQSITRVFFPDLARSVPSWRRGHEEPRRRLRSTWKATAAGVVALAKLHPGSVTSLARGPLPPGLASLVHVTSHPTV